jgi:hypothetical protein
MKKNLGSIIGALALLAVMSTVATANDQWIHACRVGKNMYPLLLDTAKKTIEWRGVTYRIADQPNCGKSGWTATKGKTTFDFCIATQGWAFFTDPVSKQKDTNCLQVFPKLVPINPSMEKDDDDFLSGN